MTGDGAHRKVVTENKVGQGTNIYRPILIHLLFSCISNCAVSDDKVQRSLFFVLLGQL